MQASTLSLLAGTANGLTAASYDVAARVIAWATYMQKVSNNTRQRDKLEMYNVES